MSNLNLFKDDPNSVDDTDPDDSSWVRSRFDAQWLYAVAYRESLSVAYRRSIEYAQVFLTADKYAPLILGRQVLLFKPGESKNARFYRERAALLTRKRQLEEGATLSVRKRQQKMGSTENAIQPIDILDRDIQELEDLLKSDNGRSRTQREKLEELYNTRREFEEQQVVRHEEPEVLRHEWDRGLNLPTFFPQSETEYHDFALPDERVMRIRFVHSTKIESITGVDFIYEYHLPKEQKARLAAVQYKLPKRNSKNIVIEDEIQAQLDRMCTVFCDNELCAGPQYDDDGNRRYQLPPCCAFFRPTDRLQQFDSRLATTGYHIPQCDIDRVCEYTRTEKRNKVITPEISMKHGISHRIFEELFNTEKLGSRWLTYEQLEKFHQAYEITKPSEQAGIYIQEAPVPTLFQ